MKRKIEIHFFGEPAFEFMIDVPESSIGADGLCKDPIIELKDDNTHICGFAIVITG